MTHCPHGKLLTEMCLACMTERELQTLRAENARLLEERNALRQLMHDIEGAVALFQLSLESDKDLRECLLERMDVVTR